MRTLWLMAAASVAVGAIAIPAEAVVSGTGDGTQNTSAPVAAGNITISGWDNVGQLATDGASAIYLGNGWVLTADHVVVGGGGGNPNGLTFDSVPGTYYWDGSPIQTLTSVTYGNADLVMYHLSSSPDLPELTIGADNQDSTFYAIGYGLNRSSTVSYYTNNGGTLTTDSSYHTGDYTGYVVGQNGSSKQWGSGTTNTGLAAVTDGYGDTIAFSSNFGATGAQLEEGDSGGGVFDSTDELIGVNLGINPPDGITSQPEAAIYGDYSFYTDLAYYDVQIQEILATPEPASSAVIVLGIAAAVLRRRRPAAG